MAIGEGTLQRIAQGGTLPQNTLAGQMAAQRRKRQLQEAKMQQSLRELAMEQQKEQRLSKKQAMEAQQQRREQILKRAMGIGQKIVSSGQVPDQLPEKTAALLGTDPNNPRLEDIRAGTKGLYAQLQGKLPETAQPQERASTAERLGISEALGVEPGTEVKYTGEPPRVNEQGEIVNEQNITGFERTGPEKEAQSPVDEAKAGMLKDQFKKQMVTENNAQQTEQLVAGMSDLITDPSVETGAVQPYVTGLQNLTQSVGIDLTSFAKGAGYDLGDLGKKEEFDRLAKELTINQFKQFKGNLNRQETKLARESVANLGKSKKGNIRALASMRASAELAQRRARQLRNVDSEKEFDRIKNRIEEQGTEEFIELRKEYIDQIKGKIEQNKEAQGEQKEVQTEGLSAEQARKEIPEGYQLGEKQPDGSWTVLDNEGNVAGQVVPE